MVPLIALEEHYRDALTVKSCPADESEDQKRYTEALLAKLTTLGEERLTNLSANGIAIQVIMQSFPRRVSGCKRPSS